MIGTSRARRLKVVEPIPDRHGADAQEPASSPAVQPDSSEAQDLDAALTGMAMLLRVALRLMKSYGDR
jgi:hypothetical protein